MLVDIETEWNLKSIKRAGYISMTQGRYRNRMEFKGLNRKNAKRLWRSRYRNRMEFKVLPLSDRYLCAYTVDIETEWNLKLYARSCCTVLSGRYRNRMEFKVDPITEKLGEEATRRYRNRMEFKVNSKNLKLLQKGSRYRNRMEFKDANWNISARTFLVDIETEWNLKGFTSRSCKGLISRYRNRMEFKV